MTFVEIHSEFAFFQDFIDFEIDNQKKNKNSSKQAQKSTKNGSFKPNFERDELVLNTIAMRLTEKESLRYLSNHGHSIQKTTYYRIKKHLREYCKSRTHYIASRGLLEKHQERIDKLETIEFEMWYNYNKEVDPTKRVSVLEKIANIQPYIAAAYDNTRVVMEKQTELQKKFQSTQEITK